MAARAYRDFDPHVRTRLLARVAAGAWLKDVCGEAGAPSYASVHAWAKAEPGFAAALARARAEGQWRRDAVIDEGVARALLGRLAAGEGIVSVLRDPAMPSRRVYRLWRSQHADFAEAVARINQGKLEAKRARGRARRRGFDQRLADRIVARVATGVPLEAVLTADPGLPGRPVVTRWRLENAEFGRALAIAVRARRQWALGRARCTPALVDEICERIWFGATLATIGLEPGMPCRATLYGWMKRLRGFREAVAEAWRTRSEVLADIAQDEMRTMGKEAYGGWKAVDLVERKMGRLVEKAERWEAM